jgi:Tfp pilus assembly protein PilV
MSKGQTSANDYLRLVYNATAITNIADNAASAPLTLIYVALHSADVADTATQNSNEISYTGYARVGVARTTGGWTVTTDSVSPVAAINFGACTAGSATATHWSTGVGASGATKVLHSGPIGSRLGPFTAAVSDTITIPGLASVSVNDRICFYATNGSALPTGMTSGQVYFVLTVSGDAITVSTTQGGLTLDLTSVGDGVAFKVTPIVITSSPSVTPQLSTGTVITEE